MSGAFELTVRREIAAPAERLFDAWLDTESLGTWMRPSVISETRAENDPRVGGEFRIVMSATRPRSYTRGPTARSNGPAGSCSRGPHPRPSTATRW